MLFFISDVRCLYSSVQQVPIDRKALVSRNNPQFSAFDSLASLSVGNGVICIYGLDVTGLQTFPDAYKKGVPLVRKVNGDGIVLLIWTVIDTKKH